MAMIDKIKNQKSKIKNIRKPIVAIVGRANVGKSTLFNRLIGKRQAIEFEKPGTTRDRIYGEVQWCGESFILVDTAGIVMEDKDAKLNLATQIEYALTEADLILFMVDLKEGLTPRDREAAEQIRKKNKKIILVANKVDIAKSRQNKLEFYRLGLGEPQETSAISGTGSGDLLDVICTKIGKRKINKIYQDYFARIAIVGRPNVGKSTLLNIILGQDRSVVSEKPGTTRDSIDSELERAGKKYLFIDTAGIRRRGRIKKGIEKFSVLRAIRSIGESDVVCLILDAEEGIVAQDASIAGIAADYGKGLIICVNKIDKINLSSAKKRILISYLQDKMSFVYWAPVLFISAKTGKNIDIIFKLIEKIMLQRNKKISDSTLSEMLDRVISQHPPISLKGQAAPNIASIKQMGVNPPKFYIKVSSPVSIHFSYKRFLENQIRSNFDFKGTPIKMSFIKY